MRKKKPSGPSNVSWRQIRQTAARKVVTAHARRKILMRFLRGGGVVAAVAAIAVGSYYAFHYGQRGMDRVNTVLPAQPLREIVFVTNGVLTREWAEAVLALPREAEIMSIDLQEQKLRLEASGQVEAAVVRRQPDRLLIDIRERIPVARLATRGASGEVVELIVDRGGYVYRGWGYNRHELNSLPFLAGVGLHRSGDGFRPLEGIDRVDDLLREAGEKVPYLRRNWRVVDCGEKGLLKVRGDEIREIIFSTSQGFADQLRMLDYTVEYNRRQLVNMENEIVDLSFGNQVVVR